MGHGGAAGGVLHHGGHDVGTSFDTIKGLVAGEARVGVGKGWVLWNIGGMGWVNEGSIEPQVRVRDHRKSVLTQTA